ncbi:hypothetical protein SETIT_1G339200v2 [Setaria italica]|uniref:Uncharacterized protein n=2 Tax=Setaria TaxID=4554 RepID=K3YX59_SETIT|nr:hypothetical protein SETIT_1G339200v2 [Setaria italica]TKW41866.1 hypothetical protein SEVIR_1G345900v2 [Setaria viridis]
MSEVVQRERHARCAGRCSTSAHPDEGYFPFSISICNALWSPRLPTVLGCSCFQGLPSPSVRLMVAVWCGNLRSWSFTNFLRVVAANHGC